jgi:hypothetical protein
MAMYNNYKNIDPGAKLVSPNFVPERLTKVVKAKIVTKKLTDKDQEKQQIEQAEKFDTSEFTIKEFREGTWSELELKAFTKDSRKTIQKEAIKILK